MSKLKDQQTYPGAATEVAEVTPEMEREATRCLNNNPRNSGSEG